MPVYKYKNYDEYKRIQIEGNKKKLSFCWANRDDIRMLAEYISPKLPKEEKCTAPYVCAKAKGLKCGTIRFCAWQRRGGFGLCHGTRQGKEQEWFRKFLDIEVIGTEISPTATQFPHTILWDFHNVKPEWVGNVDFIFSNSFDHTYKPARCLDAWMKCVKKGGVCIIEWSKAAVPVTKLDPYGGNLEQYKHLIRAKYVLKDVLPATPTKQALIRKTCFLVAAHS
jgi:hypothetical protein